MYNDFSTVEAYCCSLNSLEHVFISGKDSKVGEE